MAKNYLSWGNITIGVRRVSQRHHRPHELITIERTGTIYIGAKEPLGGFDGHLCPTIG